MPSDKPPITELAERLGHSFSNIALLQDAVTHPSLSGAAKKKKGGTAYERLEFLGDRVLGLVVAEWLYQHYPHANEGDLAKRHAALVNREALRVIANEINLGQFMRLARGEGTDDARRNRAALPDAMEAVLAALYLDGGMAAAHNFIHKYWERGIAVSEAPADPKTALQEWAQGKGKPLPDYTIVARSGPAHAPKFVVSVSVAGYDAVEAEGNSKRDAEKAAATILLQSIGK